MGGRLSSLGEVDKRKVREEEEEEEFTKKKRMSQPCRRGIAGDHGGDLGKEELRLPYNFSLDPIIYPCCFETLPPPPISSPFVLHLFCCAHEN